MPETEPLSAEQQAAQTELDRIDADKAHPANNPHHPGHEAALEQKLQLRRTRLADKNEVRALYHEPGDTGVLPQLPPPGPTVSWSDFPTLAPSEMTRPDVTRFQAVATELGATVYEGVRLLNLTRSALPAEEDAPDFTEYWGADWRVKAERVGALMRQIRAAAPDFYERLAPHLTRRTDVADHVLAVAERLAGVPASPRPNPAPRALREAEPVDRGESRWPFVWTAEPPR
jgi:hypothetical protein